MSSYASTSGPSVQPAPRDLATLVQGFDHDAAGHGEFIRRLLRADREAFYARAIEILRNSAESPGIEFLMSVLAGDELLLRALGELRLTKEQGLALARAAVHAGVMVDVILAKHLSERAGSIGSGTCPPDMQRLMDILSETAELPRVIPCLARLSRDDNPYLQSKAVLVIGRIKRNVKWVLERLTEADPRVRANAIEALWGIDTEEVRRLLRSAGRDDNNRVVGNALIALYRLGDGWAIPELLKMADHKSPRFRATAAWIMGQTGDPRFTKTLARMVGEPDIAVRTRAFAALGQIRAATAQTRQAGEWRVVARFERNHRGGGRELHLEVSSKDGSEQVVVLPTQVILNEDSQEVVSYSLEERPVPAPLLIAFIFPRTPDLDGAPFQNGALNALRWKRPSDLWAVAPYIPGVHEQHGSQEGEESTSPAVEPSVPDLDPPSFTDDPKVLADGLGKLGLESQCPTFWGAVRRSIRVGGGPDLGKRHIVVFGQSEGAPPGDYPALASAVKTSRTVVHAVSLVANPALEGLCQASLGTFQIVASEDEVALRVEEICLGLQARYTVRYRPTGDALNLRVVVNTPLGFGEVTLPIPKSAPVQAGEKTG